ILLDREEHIFSRFWREGDPEISHGYLPLFHGVPKGLVLTRTAAHDPRRIDQWLSSRGETLPRRAARRWGVDPADIQEFFDELWRLLAAELELLVSVTLRGPSAKALPNCHGAHQIDGDRLILAAHRGLYRCDTCRRGLLRATPGGACPVWRCEGTLRFEEESDESYDLMLLDEDFVMVRAEEHSAQVPAEKREKLERAVKSGRGGV